MNRLIAGWQIEFASPATASRPSRIASDCASQRHQQQHDRRADHAAADRPQRPDALAQPPARAGPDRAGGKEDRHPGGDRSHAHVQVRPDLQRQRADQEPRQHRRRSGRDRQRGWPRQARLRHARHGGALGGDRDRLGRVHAGLDAADVHVRRRVARQVVVREAAVAHAQDRQRGSPRSAASTGSVHAPRPPATQPARAPRRHVLLAVAHRPEAALGLEDDRLARADRVEAQRRASAAGSSCLRLRSRPPSRPSPTPRSRGSARSPPAPPAACRRAVSPAPARPPRRRRCRWRRARPGCGPDRRTSAKARPSTAARQAAQPQRGGRQRRLGQERQGRPLAAACAAAPIARRLRRGSHIRPVCAASWWATSTTVRCLAPRAGSRPTTL